MVEAVRTGGCTVHRQTAKVEGDTLEAQTGLGPQDLCQAERKVLVDSNPGKLMRRQMSMAGFPARIDPARMESDTGCSYEQCCRVGDSRLEK